MRRWASLFFLAFVLILRRFNEARDLKAISRHHVYVTEIDNT